VYHGGQAAGKAWGKPGREANNPSHARIQVMCSDAMHVRRSAGNPHATFCGSRRWVTAVGDPVLAGAIPPGYPAWRAIMSPGYPSGWGRARRQSGAAVRCGAPRGARKWRRAQRSEDAGGGWRRAAARTAFPSLSLPNYCS